MSLSASTTRDLIVLGDARFCFFGNITASVPDWDRRDETDLDADGAYIERDIDWDGQSFYVTSKRSWDAR